MATLQTIAAAVAEEYTRDQIVVWRKAAIDALMAELPRVELIGANFEVGGTSGQFVAGKPERVLEICNLALKILDGSGANRNDSIVHGDFSRRRVGW